MRGQRKVVMLARTALIRTRYWRKKWGKSFGAAKAGGERREQDAGCRTKERTGEVPKSSEREHGKAQKVAKV